MGESPLAVIFLCLTLTPFLKAKANIHGSFRCTSWRNSLHCHPSLRRNIKPLPLRLLILLMGSLLPRRRTTTLPRMSAPFHLLQRHQHHWKLSPAHPMLLNRSTVNKSTRQGPQCLFHPIPRRYPLQPLFRRLLCKHMTKTAR